jgi:hypothetical protein
MPVAQPRNSDGTFAQTDDEYTLDSVGIEFEYPVAQDAEDAPATSARRSTPLRRQHSGWEPTNGGSLGIDHVGTEIRSDVMDLHSDEPSDWYRECIEFCEEAGHPFAACGEGQTAFGLHHHISELREDEADVLAPLTQNPEPWLRVFACGSVMPYSADPWRHYGHSLNHRSYNGPDHYEWRLPEPVAPEHHDLILQFLRRVEYDGMQRALDWAHDLVLDRDERLTAIQQYRAYEEEIDDFPRGTGALDDDNQGRGTDADAAEFMFDLMRS